MPRFIPLPTILMFMLKHRLMQGSHIPRILILCRPHLLGCPRPFPIALIKLHRLLFLILFLVLIVIYPLILLLLFVVNPL